MRIVAPGRIVRFDLPNIFITMRTNCGSSLRESIPCMRSSGVAIAIVASVMAGCRSHPQPKSVIGWRPVGSWSGRGNAQTDSFNIDSGQWRIKWATTNETSSGSGTFHATVHSAVSGRPLLEEITHRGLGQGTAYVNEDPRLFDIDIESANIDWSVSVEEAVAGTLP